MQKDSNGFIGFIFKNGRIKSLVKDSSAARNGLLTDHQLIEVGGQNVVGLNVRKKIFFFFFLFTAILDVCFVNTMDDDKNEVY